MIDVNVHLSRWPFRRLALDETPALVARLRSLGIRAAWVSSFDGVLHRDIGSVNAWLADECRRHGAEFLVPFGVINPMLPDWEEDLRRCVRVHEMLGIRVYPAYHGYTLGDPAFIRLVRLASESRTIVQIALSLEDARTQHPLVRVAPVDVRPLLPIVKQVPELPIVLLNAFHSLRPASPELAELITAGRVGVEIATLEGVGGIETLLQSVPLDRVLFGSHAPFFCVESALLKLDESALAQPQRRAITADNAPRLLTGKPTH